MSQIDHHRLPHVGTLAGRGIATAIWILRASGIGRWADRTMRYLEGAMYKKLFGETLKRVMESKRVSVVQLAAALGLSDTMVKKYIRGQNFTEGEYMIKMALYLNVSTDVLYGLKPLNLDVAVEDRLH